MINVLALTGGRRLPSARFRVRQYIEPLGRRGVAVRERPSPISAAAELPFRSQRFGPRSLAPLYAGVQVTKVLAQVPGVLASRRATLTWLQKPLVHGHLTMEPALGSPLLFDLDDAMWLAGPFGRKGTTYAAKRATAVIAGNRYLADWLGDHNPEVHIVPTAVDTRRFRPEDKASDGRFRIGWTGTGGNLPFLYDIEEELRHFWQEAHDADLVVMADVAPRFSRLPVERVRYVPWSPDTEASVLRSFSVGLMPLPDLPWTRGKCSFKLLQYMASGVPFIASPVGMNADLLVAGHAGVAAGPGPGEWLEALRHLYRHPDERRAMGAEGRSLVEQRYDTEVVASQLAEILHRWS
ncbi:MAG TPA: glycosyltransferase family 4 protein [Acidimicrobiales bacterium]|nr:glycosyltransferase family 4 protein [Acidimicrobiales bacterium]